MKKLLVITYYWPPMSGGGVQRILKFCKYLPEFGYAPIVISGDETRDVTLIDESLTADTADISNHKIPFWFNPVRWLASSNPSAGHQASAPSPLKLLIRKVSEFMWLNVLIPDSKIGWYRPVKHKISDLLKHHAFDGFITTGPPYTAHLIGRFIKKRYGLPWLADIRDPWVENAYYNIAYRFGFVKSIHRRLEKKVLNGADTIITVGEHLAELLGQKTDSKKIHVIYNGFDTQDFADMHPEPLRSHFRLGYYGSMNEQQVPMLFIKHLGRLLQEDKAFSDTFRWDIFGTITSGALQAVRTYIPEENLSIYPPVSHIELHEEYKKEQVLLLLINNIELNKLIITGKIFEYFSAGWPILGVGPVGGEAAGLIEKSNTGKLFSHEDEIGPVAWLRSLHAKWQSHELEQRRVTDARFERKQQTAHLAQILDHMLNQNT
jgi:glycosyltransferase involved in cell wall biosynthesis